VPFAIVEEANQGFEVVAAFAGLEEQATAAAVPAVPIASKIDILGQLKA
jgi:hypothetical protein